MRKVDAALMIRKPAREVWRVVSEVPNWEAFSETFAGYAFKFRYAVTSGPKDPPAAGTAVAVTDAKGRPIMDCRVTMWDAPRRFEITAERPPGWLKGYHMLISVNLSELDDDLTNCELSFIVMFRSRIVELASLFMPVRFLYRRRLLAVLAQIRASVQ